MTKSVLRTLGFSTKTGLSRLGRLWRLFGLSILLVSLSIWLRSLNKRLIWGICGLDLGRIAGLVRLQGMRKQDLTTSGHERVLYFQYFRQRKQVHAHARSGIAYATAAP